MSRWSKEEDNYILEFIQEVNEDINYSELVKAHNETFGTKRTEDTYKVRLRKVARENDITLKSNNHWTNEEKEILVKIISANPLNINWQDISKQFNRTETSVRTMYNDLVTPYKHIEYCSNSISETDISNIIKTLEVICNNCNKSVYNVNPLIWDNHTYCDDCHYNLYNDIIMERWKKISEYSCKTDKNKCNICNKHCDYTQHSFSKFNYDHKNMFEKSNSIYTMNKQGIHLEEIYKEIDLCQLLCISCHSIITTIEQKTGFNRIKINITKEYNKTNDNEQKEKIMKQYSEIYEKYMNSVYDIVRKLI